VKFLVDENTGVVVARWLREQNYEVFSVYEVARGTDDETILQKAINENWILITCDKDFEGLSGKKTTSGCDSTKTR
jgi:predicted nuclease of predicted toxin-antitoxin system